MTFGRKPIQADILRAALTDYLPGTRFTAGALANDLGLSIYVVSGAMRTLLAHREVCRLGKIAKTNAYIYVRV